MRLVAVVEIRVVERMAIFKDSFDDVNTSDRVGTKPVTHPKTALPMKRIEKRVNRYQTLRQPEFHPTLVWRTMLLLQGVITCKLDEINKKYF